MIFVTWAEHIHKLYIATNITKDLTFIYLSNIEKKERIMAYVLIKI